jgi:hypothetical protein
MSTFDIDEMIYNAFNTIMPGKDPTTGENEPFPIPENEDETNNLLQFDTLKGRFYADMIKDMGVPYSGTTSLTNNEIIDILNKAFGADSPFINEEKQPNNKGEYVYLVNANAYKSQTLQQRYNQIMRENANNIKQYRNILKTSVTAVSGYSNARYQFYESGLGVKRICANKGEGECINVDTAAAHLDTAGKDKSDATAHFNMLIDPDTFVSYGFPPDTLIQTNWINENNCKIAINRLPNPQDPKKLINNFILLYPNRNTELLGPYTLGNAQKNQALLSALVERNVDPNIMKYILLVKEFGDVLQVMEYYGIVTYLEEHLGVSSAIIRPRFNMQTTDSVVFDLCVSLGLPCTYTGSREGVTSGGITVIMYEYVPTPPATILQNRLTSIYQGLNGRLNSLKFGINRGLTILNSLSYEIPEGYVAPGKSTRPSRSASRGTTPTVSPMSTPRVSRSRSPLTESPGIPTDAPVRLEPADNFYAHTNIMHIIDPNAPANDQNFRNMTLSESVQLKRNLLSLLLDAVENASIALKTQFDNIDTTTNAVSLNADIQNGTTLLENATTIMLGTQELGFDEDPIVKVKGTGWIIRNPILVEWFAYFSGYFPRGIPFPIKFDDTGSFTYNNGENMINAYTYPNFTPTTIGGDGKKTWNLTSKNFSSSLSSKGLRQKGLRQKGGTNTEELTFENCVYLKTAQHRVAEQLLQKMIEKLKQDYIEHKLNENQHLSEYQNLSEESQRQNFENEINGFLEYIQNNFSENQNGFLEYIQNNLSEDTNLSEDDINTINVLVNKINQLKYERNQLIKDNTETYELIALKFSELHSESRVNPLLYPKLLLDFDGYLEQKYDSDGNPLIYDSDGNPLGIYNSDGTVIEHIEINNIPREHIVLDHDQTTNNIVATFEGVNYLVTVNISEEIATQIMEEMNYYAQIYLHIADVNNLEEIRSLMFTYVDQWSNLYREDIPEFDIPLPPRFLSNITITFEGRIYTIMHATYTMYYQSWGELNFVNKEVYYNDEPYPVVSVNEDNTFTLRDGNGNILPVPITEIMIQDGEQGPISVNDYINIRLNNFRYYYEWNFKPGTKIRGRESLPFINVKNLDENDPISRIENDEEINFLNALFSLWFENFIGTYSGGGNKKAKKTKKKRKTKKHTKKIKYRKKKSKSKTIRKTEKKRK